MRALLVSTQGASAGCYYRIALPAIALGHDWVGMVGQPPKVHVVTGMDGQIRMAEYDVVVIQQPRGPWLKIIRRLQAEGVRVLVEVDDYVKAIGKMADHDYKRSFRKADVDELELNMRVADGVIVSTEFLAKRYRGLNSNIWVCRNGLDFGRYMLTRPPRETVTIGWAGGTGHRKAIEPWLPAVADMMKEYPQTRFVTVGGEPFAQWLAPHFPGRCLALPFTQVEIYPCAMTLFDIVIAPAGRTLFHAGKSDLRFLEAGALGIPVVGDPKVYPTIEHGVTGLHATEPEEVALALRILIEDRELAESMGQAAREWVWTHRGIKKVAEDWRAALEAGPSAPS